MDFNSILIDRPTEIRFSENGDPRDVVYADGYSIRIQTEDERYSRLDPTWLSRTKTRRDLK